MRTPQTTAAEEARRADLLQEIMEILQQVDQHRLRVVLQFVSPLRK